MKKNTVWFDPPKLRWREVLAASGVASAVVSAWIVLTHDDAAAPPAEPPAAAPPTTVVAQVSAVRPLEGPPTPRAAVAAVRPAALKPGEVPVCGGYRARMGVDGNLQPDVDLQASIDDVRERTLAAMRSSHDEIAQGAALLLSNDFDALARRAQGSSDARLYGLAMQACSNPRAAGAAGCGMLSAHRWTQLEPDNAVPWLWLATQANKDGDGGGVAEAMYQVARARRSDVRMGLLTATALTYAPRDDAALAGSYALAMQILASESSMSQPQLQVASSYCSEAAVSDANRRFVCADVAEVMTTKSSSLIERGVGVSIGKRVGWSSERVESLRRENAAWTAAMPTSTSTLATDCAFARRALQHVRSIGLRGEVAALRASTGTAKFGGVK